MAFAMPDTHRVTCVSLYARVLSGVAVHADAILKEADGEMDF